MKKLLAFILITTLVVALGAFLLGVRILPAGMIFTFASDLAREARLDNDQIKAISLTSVTIAALALFRRFSWRRLKLLAVMIPLVVAAFFSARSFLRNRASDVADPTSIAWFSQDGRALLYYARREDGQFVFSDGPGFHRQTGLDLKPVSAQIYSEWAQVNESRRSEAEERKTLREKLAREGSRNEALEKQFTNIESKLHEVTRQLEAERESTAQLQHRTQRELAETRKLREAPTPTIATTLTAPATQSTTLTLRFSNATPYRVYLRFASPNSHVWPSPGNAYTAAPGEAIAVTLATTVGERIYFRGWTLSDPAIRWNGCDCDEAGNAKPIAIGGDSDPPLRVLLVHSSVPNAASRTAKQNYEYHDPLNYH